MRTSRPRHRRPSPAAAPNKYRPAVTPLEDRTAPAGDGLSAVYFDSPDLTAARELRGVAVSRVEPTVNFNWGSGSPVAGSPGFAADTFAARFGGRVEAVEAGTYTFRTRSDDGVRLWVDGRLVVDNWTNHSPTDNDGTIGLEAGRTYSIVMEYYESTGGAVASLSWRRPGQTAFEVIPQARLYSDNNRLPGDGLYLNLKTQYGAKGDGVTDDTAAFQRAFADATADGTGKSRYARPPFVYLPAGTYRVSSAVEARVGTAGWSFGWRSGIILVGEGRDLTTIRLDDNAAGFGDPANPRALYKTGSENPHDAGGGGNQAFRLSVRDLTLDTGSGNPGAIGLDYLANNRGAVENVRVRSGDGTGVVGIAMNRAWPGPALIKNVSVEGFDYGVQMRSHYQYSMTFEHVRLVGQKVAGVLTDNNVLHVRGLRSHNAVPVFRGLGTNNQLTIIDSEFTGGGAADPAIYTKGVLTARNLKSTGYGKVIDSEGGTLTDVAGGAGTVAVGEYLSHAPFALFPSPANTLNLPIEETPEFYTADLNQWADVTDYGATRNDGTDDTNAVQAAIDSGKAVVYLPSGDYRLSKPLLIRGSVKKITGMQSSFGAVAGSTGAVIRFTGAAGSSTTLEHISTAVPIEFAGAGTFAVQHSDMGPGITTTAAGTGKLFLEDTIGKPIKVNGPAKVWGRQVNTEFGDLPLLENNGGTLWLLGLKTEGESTVIKSVNGTTELLGALIYPLAAVPAGRVLFEETDSRASYTYMTNGSPNYPVHVRETRGGVTRDLSTGTKRVALFSGHTEVGAATAASTGDPYGVFADAPATLGAAASYGATAAGDSVTFAVAGAGAGTFEVRVRMKTGPNRGTFQLAAASALGGTYANVGGTQDWYSTASNYATRTVGTVTFTAAGTKYLRFSLTGKNAASSGFALVFDQIELVAV